MGCRTLSDSHLTVLLGNGDGTFQQPLEYPITPAEPYTLATGDLIPTATLMSSLQWWERDAVPNI